MLLLAAVLSWTARPEQGCTAVFGWQLVGREDGIENGSLQLVNASLSGEMPVSGAGSSGGMFCAWAASLLKWHVLKML